MCYSYSALYRSLAAYISRLRLNQKTEGKRAAPPAFAGLQCSFVRIEALVVQWIGRKLAELQIGVRFLSRAQR